MTSRAEAFQQHQLPDMERRVADMVKIGTVSELDYSDPKAPRVRVKYGYNKDGSDNATGWIPWAPKRAGRARTWEPLKLGEQVIIASPSGDLAQGVIIGSINFNDREAPANGAHQTVTAWDGGTREEIDDDGNTYTLDVPAGGKITFHIGQTTFELTDGEAKLTTPLLTVDSPTSIFTGDVTVQKQLTYMGGMVGSTGSGAVATISGDIEHTGGHLKSNNVTLHTHTHGGVQSGGGNTVQPNGGT